MNYLSQILQILPLFNPPYPREMCVLQKILNRWQLYGGTKILAAVGEIINGPFSHLGNKQPTTKLTTEEKQLRDYTDAIDDPDSGLVSIEQNSRKKWIYKTETDKYFSPV